MSLSERARLGVWSTVIAMILLVAFPAAASANVRETTPGQVEALSGQVKISWPAHAGALDYLVIDDKTHRVLWRGDRTTVAIPATQGRAVSALVIAVTTSTIQPIQKVLATVPDATGITPIAAVTSPLGTRLSWGAIADVSEYSVLSGPMKDDIVAKTSSVSIDVPAKLGATVSYVITGYAAATSDQSVGERYFYGVDVTPPQTDVANVPRDAKPGDVVPADVPTIRTSQLVYEPYVPLPYVQAPPVGCEGGSKYWFGGDNRGAGFNTGKYRTQAWVQYTWTGPYTLMAADVNPTRRYVRSASGTYSFVDQREASEAGIVMAGKYNDGKNARTDIKHSVAAPYCTTHSAIDYVQSQRIEQNGGHFIFGAHDQTPNHQLYRHDTYSDGTTKLELVFNHKYTSFSCLAPYACGHHNYRYVR